MKSLLIDFASGKEVRVRSYAPLWWALLVLGFAILFAATWQWASISGEQAKIAARMQAMESASSEGDDTAVAELTPETVTMANTAIRLLNHPWPTVFSRLEHHAVPGLALLSLELGAGNANGKIVLQGESVDQALAYVDSLGKENGFQKTVLSRKEPVSVEGSSAIRFTLEIPATAEEGP